MRGGWNLNWLSVYVRNPLSISGYVPQTINGTLFEDGGRTLGIIRSSQVRIYHESKEPLVEERMRTMNEV